MLKLHGVQRQEKCFGTEVLKHFALLSAISWMISAKERKICVSTINHQIKHKNNKITWNGKPRGIYLLNRQKNLGYLKRSAIPIFFNTTARPLIFYSVYMKSNAAYFRFCSIVVITEHATCWHTFRETLCGSVVTKRLFPHQDI